VPDFWQNILAEIIEIDGLVLVGYLLWANWVVFDS